MQKLLASLALAGLSLSPAQATEPPPPPELRQVDTPTRVAATPSAASAPATPASEPRRLRTRGAERVRIVEDAFNRSEEHLDARERVVRVVIHPKNGAPSYELRPTQATDEQPMVGPRRWKLMDF
ncbi:hypothetical protein [Inhella gelatinilytica]|uniref:DUF2782 domain-containing protein n=1 Tax=Inhella gelatinilytica TaxID=2795030 RepID=A0A931NEH4_9BURK|nr:hypothetical protein [Inhella gelatinilytica]MBH9554162.1 hypothetical protein [Inhella gelatinilytica]